MSFEPLRRALAARARADLDLGETLARPAPYRLTPWLARVPYPYPFIPLLGAWRTA